MKGSRRRRPDSNLKAQALGAKLSGAQDFVFLQPRAAVDRPQGLLKDGVARGCKQKTHPYGLLRQSCLAAPKLCAVYKHWLVPQRSAGDVHLCICGDRSLHAGAHLGKGTQVKNPKYHMYICIHTYIYIYIYLFIYIYIRKTTHPPHPQKKTVI